MLAVHSYGPASGPPGAYLTAQVDFRNYTEDNVRLRIVIGDLALPTDVKRIVRIKQQETVFSKEQGDWQVKIKVPSKAKVSSHMAEFVQGRFEWPLSLQALNADGDILDTIGFGLFAYEGELRFSVPVSLRKFPISTSMHSFLDSPHCQLSPLFILGFEAPCVHTYPRSPGYSCSDVHYFS